MLDGIPARVGLGVRVVMVDVDRRATGERPVEQGGHVGIEERSPAGATIVVSLDEKRPLAHKKDSAHRRANDGRACRKSRREPADRDGGEEQIEDGDGSEAKRVVAVRRQRRGNSREPEPEQQPSAPAVAGSATTATAMPTSANRTETAKS